MAEEKKVGGTIEAPNTALVTYEKRMSAKGKPYDVIMVDLGYRKIALTFDRNTISEILGISFADLYNLPVDTIKPIGEIEVG